MEINKLELNKRINELLHNIGIPDNMKGFLILKEAIIYMILQNNLEMSITKELYPYLALIFQSTPSRVERNIRTVIEIGWYRGDITTIWNIFRIQYK